MNGIRKPISKSLRFEVFKRDSFKCQYCGATAPDVLLHVDHILPVASGGNNDIANLITSCEPCNNGKRDILLSDKAALAKSRGQLEALQERREQLELMMEWQRGLCELKADEASEAARFFHGLTPGWTTNDGGKAHIRKLIRQYGFPEVLEAIRLAAESHIQVSNGLASADSARLAFDKIGLYCSVNRGRKENPDLMDLLYLRGCLRNRLSGRYYRDDLALKRIKDAHSWKPAITIQDIRGLILNCNSWTQFMDGTDELIEKAREYASRS